MLPPEITDSIIDNLGYDKVALARCSLVCKSWTPRSRLRLWKTVSVSSVGTRAARFLELAQSSPVPYFIKHLDIYSVKVPVFVSLLAELPKFSVLKTISIDSIHGTIVRVPHTSSARYTMSQVSMTISRSSFATMADLYYLVAHFSHLRSLNIDSEVYVDDIRTVPPKSSLAEGGLQLERLAIGVQDSGNAACLLSHVGPVRARSLTLVFIGSIPSWFEPIWKVCTPYIEHLRLESRGHSDCTISCCDRDCKLTALR